jgi:hypothetical protein
MKANAKLGYSNGGIIPYGYKSVDAEAIGSPENSPRNRKLGAATSDAIVAM